MSNWRTLSRSLGAVRGSHAKGGRAALRFGGGRTDLLEELGRVEGERSNPNRRAEISRVHSELNRGYKDGGRIGLKKGTPHSTKKGCTGRAKALAKTFKKMAAKRKA